MPSDTPSPSAAGPLFVDGPERPPVTVESHDIEGSHYLIAWDWSGGGWVRYDLPCNRRLTGCPR